MNIRYEVNLDNFNLIPGMPFSYWCKNFSIFDFPKLSKHYKSGGRNKTHNNELYLRNWWEIMPSIKWQPYANGGDFRRWYGNNYDVVNWSLEAREFYDSHGGLYNEKFWGKTGICWNLITSYKNSFRLKTAEFHFSSASPTIVSNDEKLDLCVLGFLNTELVVHILKMLNPTLNTTVSDVLNLPFEIKEKTNDVLYSVKSNLSITKRDWDSFETSWDFKKHPLI